MEMSWIMYAGCRMHVRSATQFVVIAMVTVTTVILLIQSSYLHLQYNPMTDSYSLAGRRIMYRRPFHDGKDSIMDIPNPDNPVVRLFRPYQSFGRETSIVRFNATTHESPYQLIDELKLKSSGPKYYIYRHPRKLSSKFNGNITIHVKNIGAYSVASVNNIYIMSAFARNFVQVPKGQTRFKQPDPSKEIRHIVLVGWLKYDLINSTLHCCLLLGNDTIVSSINGKRMVWMQVHKQPLMAVKFFCPVPKALAGAKVKGATMSLPQENCQHKKFMAVEYLKRQPEESLALCAKIAYGTMSAQRLIEWLEIQKYMGVDKVLLYYYNLNSETMRALLQYNKEGFVDLRPFDYPNSDSNNRYVGQKEAQPFIDEQVVLYEAMERLRGYTYAAVIDVDEVIYARTSHKHNLKRFFLQLFRRNPNAAGFSFRTELFITDWENKEDMGPEMNKFWHARYQNRTRPLDDRTKSVLVMDRIILGSVWTHNYTARPQYDKYNVPASMGTLKHYRPCRKNWHCFIRRGYRDQTVASMIGNVKDIITDRYKKLLDKKTISAILAKAQNTNENNQELEEVKRSQTNKSSSLNKTNS